MLQSHRGEERWNNESPAQLFSELSVTASFRNGQEASFPTSAPPAIGRWRHIFDRI